MADGWTDKRQRSLINFLIYSPKGISFVKSVDASGFAKTGKNLFELFDSVIQWVGVQNVVQVVTDNAANYDICALPHIDRLAKSASKITTFLYNHGALLHWLRERPSWKEIVRPGATRFATTFLTLDSIVHQQVDLECLMVDETFRESALGKSKLGEDVRSIIFDRAFWEECKWVVELMEPLVRLLRIVDSDEKPALGYVYEGYRRVEDKIFSLSAQNPEKVRPYMEILDLRWDKHLNQECIIAAYYLNPAMIYSSNYEGLSRAVQFTALDYLENKALCPDVDGMVKEREIFQSLSMAFARPSARAAAKNQNPCKSLLL
ncbi:hypothetical protein LINPERHAP2_LOCUS27362 [Linum perenne]